MHVQLYMQCDLNALAGVALYGGPRASDELGIPKAKSLHHEYNSMACTLEIVDDVHTAIDHIHRYGRCSLACFYILQSTIFPLVASV